MRTNRQTESSREPSQTPSPNQSVRSTCASRDFTLRCMGASRPILHEERVSKSRQSRLARDADQLDVDARKRAAVGLDDADLARVKRLARDGMACWGSASSRTRAATAPGSLRSLRKSRWISSLNGSNDLLLARPQQRTTRLHPHLDTHAPSARGVHFQPARGDEYSGGADTPRFLADVKGGRGSRAAVRGRAQQNGPVRAPWWVRSPLPIAARPSGVAGWRGARVCERCVFRWCTRTVRNRRPGRR
jgi:hypothetical protein